jgi:serine/threonine-protein kinase
MTDRETEDAFVRFVEQASMANGAQISAARRVQAVNAEKGVRIPIQDLLVQQGVITSVQRESVERRMQSAPSKPAPRQEASARQVDNYRLLKKLGQGGMGEVFLAEDVVAQRQVALKMLPKKYAEDKEFVGRFHREAKAMGKLNHQNIVSAFAFGEWQGRHYYVMEYCDGEPLDTRLKREGALPLSQALDIAGQVLQGLTHAHDHGFIHRDIKPANIFMTKDGVAKILDLGLSKDLSDAEQSFNTQSGAVMGTPHYISPEQAKGELTIDGRTDIYSLGATLYHLATGKTPFSGSNSMAVITKHLTEQLPNPQDLRPEIPDGLVLIIQKMMAKSADNRYLNCGDVLDDLDRVKNGAEPNCPRLNDDQSSVAIRLSRRVRKPVVEAAPSRKPLLICSAAGVIVLAIIVIAIASRAPSSPPSKTSQTVDTPAAKPAPPPPPPAATPAKKIDTPVPVAVEAADADAKRESYAQSLLDDVNKNTRSGKLAGWELRRRYWEIFDRHGQTRAGKEAAESIKTLQLPPRAPENPEQTHPGLNAACYAAANRDRLPGLRGVSSPLSRHVVGAISYPGEQSFAPVYGRTADLLLHFTGFIQIPKEGVYTFYLNSDDGSNLLIGDVPVAGNDLIHAMQERSGTIPMQAGKHALTIEYFNAAGAGGMTLIWSGPGIQKQPVPASAFFRAETPDEIAETQCNLLRDGGFESGRFEAWEQWGAAVIVAEQARNGKFALRTGPGESGAGYEVKHLTPSSPYTLTAWIKAGPEDEILLGVRAFGGEAEVVESCKSSEYKQVSLSFTTGAKTSSALVYVYCKGGGKKPVFVDDMSLTRKDRPSTANLRDGLVAHWKLDEGKGDYTRDGGPAALLARLFNAPKWAPGVIGQAVSFSAKDQYIELPNNPDLRDLQEGCHTISAWFKPDALPAATGDTDFAVLMKPGGNEGISLSNKGNFRMSHALADGKESAARAARAVTPGKFYHVLGCADPATGTTKIYVDGKLEGTHRFAAGAAARDFAAATWKLGISTPAAPQKSFQAKGCVDEARMYCRLLNDAEIQALADPKAKP